MDAVGLGAEGAVSAFVAGDKVVLPKHGVGTVERVGPECLAGETVEIVLVSVDAAKMTVRVPLDKAQRLGLRKLSPPGVLAEALRVVSGRPRVTRGMWTRRVKDYEAKINSGDPLAVAEVVRDLKRSQTGEYSLSERQVFDKALGRLCEEIAAVEGADRMAVTARVVARLAPALDAA
jgi:CarD family transcriptional regulator